MDTYENTSPSYHIHEHLSCGFVCQTGNVSLILSHLIRSQAVIADSVPMMPGRISLPGPCFSILPSVSTMISSAMFSILS